MSTGTSTNTAAANTTLADAPNREPPAPPSTAKGWLLSSTTIAQLRNALPKILTPERFTRIALTALTTTPKLANCKLETFAIALLKAASLGLEPDGRQAYLLPYGETAQLIVGYQGYVELARRSGQISTIFADAVCENDGFSYDTGVVKHVIDFRNPRGKPIAFFAQAKFRDGGTQCAVMTLEEVQSIRDRSQGYQAAKKWSKSSPWETDFSEMGKKTVLRRLCKLLPLSPELRDAVALHDEQESVAPTPRLAFPPAPADAEDPLYSTEAEVVQPAPAAYTANTQPANGGANSL
jgi:recombination protein RecT